MADLSQLFQTSPGAAAFMLGQNNALDQSHKRSQISELEQLIRARTQDEEFTRQLQPGKLDFQRLNNETLSAQLPGHRALSDSHIADAQYKQATNPDRIAASKAKYQGEVGDEQVNKMARTGKIMSMVGAEDQAASPGYALARLKEHGLDMNSTLGKRLASMPPEQIPAFLQKAGEAMSKTSTDFVRHKMEADARIEQHRIDTQSRERIAQAKLAADKRDKKQVSTDLDAVVQAQLLRASNNPAGQYAILSRAISAAMSSGDTALAQRYQGQLLAIENQIQNDPRLKNKPGGIDLSEHGIGTNPALDPRSPMGRVQLGAPSPTAPQYEPPQPTVQGGAQAGPPPTPGNGMRVVPIQVFRQSYPQYNDMSDDQLKALLKTKGIQLQ